MVIEKLDLQSPDLVNENFERLAELFPNCVTETANGKAIDFDLLKQELNYAVVDGTKERYRLEWPGKKEAIVTANLPTTKTLRPVREDSVDFDNTENLYIEGDNLEVLKLLQESYLGKIKMIYIDPPYNTGKDFVYKDNFTKDAQEELIESGQKDEYNQRLVLNPETSGRYHSDWLSMMYPRLKLARNLLTDDGVLFISINDKEIQNLRKMADEIFGEKNFLSCLIWNSEGNTDNQLEIKVNHEYILCYLKDVEFKDEAIGNVIDPNTREDSNLHQGFADNNINKNSPANPPDIIELPAGFPSSEEELFYPKKSLDDDFFEITKREKYISEAIKRKYNIENLSGLPIKLDDMHVANFQLQRPCRIYGGFANRNKLKEFIENGMNPVMEDGSPIRFYINGNAAVRYRKENVEPRNILSVLRNLGTTEKSKTFLKKMGVYFSYPKPIDLLSYLIRIGCAKSDSIVLDFFSGSSSTAHALLSLNSTQRIKRKFVMVQFPEPTDPTSDAFKNGYKNICEIGKERIRRAGIKVKQETGFDIDYGFRVYRLDSSNMQDVYYKPQDYKQSSIDLFADNLKPDRTADDLLAQVMLDWGLPLSLKIEQLTIADKKVFRVAENSLYACFESGIDEAFAKEVAKDQPLRVVFRDSGFKDDTAKTNVKQLLKQLSTETEMKVI
jgi:adenine-specific DNA-methyltransferase